MRKTVEITYLCNVRYGKHSKYFLEETQYNEYNFVTVIAAADYTSNISYYVPACYVIDTSRPHNLVYDVNSDFYTLTYPIMKDAVSMSDFKAYEDKQLTLPIGYYIDSMVSMLTPLTPEHCLHGETYLYTGLSHTDTYCKKCEKKL